jgi:hypothetical protein
MPIQESLSYPVSEEDLAKPIPKEGVAAIPEVSIEMPTEISVDAEPEVTAAVAAEAAGPSAS